MQREARSDRGWEQWPGRRGSEDRGRSRLRALFQPSDSTAVAELAALDEREVENGLAAFRHALTELEDREGAVAVLEADVRHLLVAGSSELDRFQDELDAREAALDARDRSLALAESVAEERRRELGAVELKRAALEQRSAGLEERESALEQRADELAALARQLQKLGESLSQPEATMDEATTHLLLSTEDGYRIATADGAPPATGARIELDGRPYRCVRVSRSPYPADSRRCAVLEREEPVSD